MQNPIKKWDLVYNDDFQNELSRFFRQRKLFYERRTREWNYRRTELKALGISRGPNIKKLMQYIACYYWGDKRLGPAIAYQSVSRLFEDKAYNIITKTTSEHVFQIYLMSEVVTRALLGLKKFKYIDNFKTYIRFSLFALIVRISQRINVKWGDLNDADHNTGIRRWIN